MPKTIADYRQEIIDEVQKLPREQAKEVRDFIFFLKNKKIFEKIDPDQLYFWTPRWQEMEKAADEDKKAGRFREFSSVDEYKQAIEKEIRARRKSK